MNDFEMYMDEYYEAGTETERYEALTKALVAAQGENNQRNEAFCRLKLASMELFSGRKNRFVSHILWCLKNINDDMIEADDEIYDLLLWNAKYIIVIGDYVNISKQTVLDLFNFVKNLYEKYGQNLKPVYGLLLYFDYIGLNLGCEIEQVFDQWIHTKNVEFDDCKACLKDTEICYYIRRGEDEKAVELSRIFGQNRYLNCTEAPSLTYARLLPSLLKIGDIELADLYAKKSFELSKNDPDLVSGVLRSLAYQSVKDPQTSLRKYSAHIHLFEKTETDFEKLDFFFYSFVLFSNLLKTKNTVSMPFSNKMEFFREDHIYQAEELKRFFEKKYQNLALLFDKRNESSYMSERLDIELSLYGLN